MYISEILAQLSNEKFQNANCHLDPDIRANILEKRPDGWKPAFGQCEAASSHLINQGVGVGDLFLFFGLFQKVETDAEEKYQFVKTANPQHIIWGYLQVDEILNNPISAEYPWLGKHPHLDKDYKNNVIFVARETLSWNKTKKGADVLKYKPSLVLTKEGEGLTTSCWELPDFMRSVKISYHSEKRWEKDYLKSVGRGQEFVFSADENPQIMEWVKNLIA
jgi:hypothetical protein